MIFCKVFHIVRDGQNVNQLCVVSDVFSASRWKHGDVANYFPFFKFERFMSELSENTTQIFI